MVEIRKHYGQWKSVSHHLSPYRVSRNPHKHLSMKEEIIKLTDLQGKQSCSHFMLTQKRLRKSKRLREGPVSALEPRICAFSLYNSSNFGGPRFFCSLPRWKLGSSQVWHCTYAPLEFKRSTACSALKAPGACVRVFTWGAWILICWLACRNE